MTLSPREQREADIARALIEAAGGLEAAAEFAEIGKSQLGRYQSKADRDSMPLRVIAALEAVTHGVRGHPIVTRFLARAAGYSLVELPEGTADRADMLQLAAKAAQQRGDADSAMMASLADSVIDHDEAHRLIPLMRQRVETDVQILTELEAIVGNPS